MKTVEERLELLEKALVAILNDEFFYNDLSPEVQEFITYVESQQP